MATLISQDGLKAIDIAKIDFYYIPPDKNIRGKYCFQAKSAKSPAENGYYDFLNLFEHENIETVKAVMKFLVAFQFSCPDDYILQVDLPELARLGMKGSLLLSKSDFEQTKNSAQ